MGQLRVRGEPLRVLVAGREAVAEDARFDRVVDLLHEISGLRVDEQNAVAPDPLDTIREGGYDLLLNVEGESATSWLLYTAETSRARYLRLEGLVTAVDRAIRALPDPGADRVSDVGSRTMALILCLLPFMLAAPSLIREREAHTLEPLLAAPGIGPGTVALGKGLYVLAVSLFNLLVMLLVAQTFHSLSAKTGLFRMVLFLLPALLSSIALGFVVSALARSQTQVVIGLALYLVAMTLFSGFLYPLEEAHWVIRAISLLFPLTFVHRDLTAWLIGSGPMPFVAPATLALWLQALALAGAAAAAIRTCLRRL